MPISRVRSATAISMMFMITMPPTMSEIDTSIGRKVIMIFEILFQPSSAASEVCR